MTELDRNVLPPFRIRKEAQQAILCFARGQSIASPILKLYISERGTLQRIVMFSDLKYVGGYDWVFSTPDADVPFVTVVQGEIDLLLGQELHCECAKGILQCGLRECWSRWELIEACMQAGGERGDGRTSTIELFMDSENVVLVR